MSSVINSTFLLLSIRFLQRLLFSSENMLRYESLLSQGLLCKTGIVAHVEHNLACLSYGVETKIVLCISSKGWLNFYSGMYYTLNLEQEFCY